VILTMILGFIALLHQGGLAAFVADTAKWGVVAAEWIF